MKLEIDLDLNKIDYDAINKQIQEKIAEMNLAEMYSINSKIDNKIKEEVEIVVNQYTNYNDWSGLNNTVKRDIKSEINSNIKELIKPHVENIFNQIPQEELNKMIEELIPMLLIDMISSNLKTIVANYYCSTQAEMHRICEEKINNIIRGY